MDNLEKFKHVLEYFVAHLSYVSSGNPQSIGYLQYIKPLVDDNTFNKAGKGWMEHSIQNQIKDWDMYGDNQLYINITASFGKYNTRGCYLNWKDTGFNIAADWNGDSLVGLRVLDYLYWEKPARWVDKNKRYSIDELGLFKNGKYTAQFVDFYDYYFDMIKKLKKEQCIEKYVNLLEKNHNLILTGAPGTGKTYLAKAIARQMGGEGNRVDFVQFHPSYDYTDFIEGLRPVNQNGTVVFERKDGVFKAFCKDAVELSGANVNEEDARKMLEWFKSKPGMISIPSVRSGNNMSFEVKNGTIFAISSSKIYHSLKEKSIVRYIMTNKYDLRHESYEPTVGQYIVENYPDKSSAVSSGEKEKFVFIIDEINRGEISKIFGELFFAIDSGYRGKKVATQYQNLVENDDIFADGFYVPDNVYIIGTMNDIDRSVESMDFAFRRRFAFKEVVASENTGMLDVLGDELKEAAVLKMNNLNAAIENCQELGRQYQIGAAYFLKLQLYDGSNEDRFSSLWENHLRILLEDYLRGLPGRDEKLNVFKAEYDK